jgi:malonyl-CoA/methylmalonyl-CoA synthetase
MLTDLAPSIPVHEGLYFVQTSTSDAILTAASCSKLGHDLAKSARASNPLFFCVDLKPLICKPPLRIDQITMSSDWFLDYFGAGVVIFTSGTTGPPKGAVRSRSFLDAMAQRTADHYGLHRGDVVMHTLPVHHTTGIGTTFMPFIISGAGVEFNSGGFDPQRVWERWRKGGLTFFSGVPTMYMRLMRYYENVIIKMPLHKQKEYVDGAQRFRSLLCGTAALPHSLQQKWQELRNGRRILERYGSTESSTVFTVNPDDLECPDVSLPSR